MWAPCTWTNVGVPNLDDGSIEHRRPRRQEPQDYRPTRRYAHAENESTSIIDGGKLYWCDREGMRVMRANLDGSYVETLVETGRGDKDRRDETRWCVGITLDPKLGEIYWTKKARTTPVSAVSSGPTSTSRRARARRPLRPEVLFDQLAGTDRPRARSGEPFLYWTDRGDPPRGNTVNRAPIDTKAAPEILITHLMEGIGIALDVPGNQMFVTDFAGSVYSADLDGKNERNFLYGQGNLTGIAYAEI